VAITGGSRRLLNRQDWVEEEDYQRTAECFEQLPLSKAILSSPAVVTPDEWRRNAATGPLSRNDLKAAAEKLSPQGDTGSAAHQDDT
jgi:hypothetical protein